MPFNYTLFMAKVREDNPNFKRFARTSHLDPIIAEVKDKTFITPALKDRLETLIAFMPHDHQQKYPRALGHLTSTAGVRVLAIPANAKMKFTGFMIKTGGYTGYNSRGESKNVLLDPGTPGSPGPRSLVHNHTLSWESSNGNVASLATVRTREYVKFLADTQAPPFNAIQDPDREFYGPSADGNAGGTSNTDEHSTKLPALICCYPRQAGTLMAEQWYQYSVDNGATWKNMEGGAFQIEKTVRKEGNDWVYIFKKTNWLPHNTKRFHFEVHYTIGEPPEYMPRRDSDVGSLGLSAAEMRRYARKIVATG
jgi:hypothetical protein